MRILVTGSRHFDDELCFATAVKYFQLNYGCLVSHLVVGGSQYGLDGVAFRWAQKNDIDHTVISAKWTKGKSAGPERNTRMVNFAKEINVNYCLGFWDGKEERSGTLDTLRKAKEAGMKIHAWKFKENGNAAISDDIDGNERLGI